MQVGLPWLLHSLIMTLWPHAGCMSGPDGMSCCKASATELHCGTAMPGLPSDVWAAIARAALAAEECDIMAWARLSLVARAWRDGLRGAYSAYVFVWERGPDAATANTRQAIPICTLL